MARVMINLPTYARNRNGRLAAAIDSVRAQTFTDWELCIVDDGSTDGSRETIAEAVAADPRVRTMRFEPNIGLPVMTTGRSFAASDSEWLACMFDDCVWRPELLEHLIAVSEQDPSAGVVYGQAIAHFPGHDAVVGEPLDLGVFEAGHNQVPNAATLTRRTVIDQVGWYDPNVILKRKTDWDFWLRCARVTPFRFSPQVLMEEFGPLLPDSLGNAVSYLGDLVARYVAVDRNDILQLRRIDDWDPYAVPPEVFRDREDAEDALFLAVEHRFRHGAPTEPETPGFSRLMEQAGRTPAELTLVALAGGRRRTAELAAARAADQAFIQTQRAIIDEKQAYIMELIASIEARQPYIMQLIGMVESRQAELDALRGG